MSFSPKRITKIMGTILHNLEAGPYEGNIAVNNETTPYDAKALVIESFMNSNQIFTANSFSTLFRDQDLVASSVKNRATHEADIRNCRK